MCVVGNAVRCFSENVGCDFLSFVFPEKRTEESRRNNASTTECEMIHGEETILNFAIINARKYVVCKVENQFSCVLLYGFCTRHVLSPFFLLLLLLLLYYFLIFCLFAGAGIGEKQAWEKPSCFVGCKNTLIIHLPFFSFLLVRKVPCRSPSSSLCYRFLSCLFVLFLCTFSLGGRGRREQEHPMWKNVVLSPPSQQYLSISLRQFGHELRERQATKEHLPCELCICCKNSSSSFSRSLSQCNILTRDDGSSQRGEKKREEKRGNFLPFSLSFPHRKTEIISFSFFSAIITYLLWVEMESRTEKMLPLYKHLFYFFSIFFLPYLSSVEWRQGGLTDLFPH